MGTHGVGAYSVNSKYSSGNLVFYEKAYGLTTTGNILKIGTTAVQIGDTANDVDFAWNGDTTGTFTLDAGAHTLAMTGMATSTDGIFTISNATEATSTTAGALVVTGGIAFAKDMYVGDDVFLTSAAKLDWAAGNALLTHSTGLLTFSASNVAFGVDATGIDVTFFGDTASHKVWFDQNGDTNGAWYFGADTKGILTNWYGDVTGYYVKFDPSGDTNGAWYFGADDFGVDVAFYGQTAGKSMLWDASADKLIIVGSADLGTTCEADAYTVGATPGADHNGAANTFTVVKGIITAISQV